MRISFFVFLFGVLQGFSQISNDEFVLKLLFDLNKESILTYSEKSIGYSKLVEIISKKTLKGFKNPKTRLKLSENEIELIKEQIKKNKNYIFPPNLFVNSRIVSLDSIASYFTNKNKIRKKEMIEIIKTKDSLLSAEFSKQKGFESDWIHFFSKPIFFRNRTLCIIYYAKICCFNSGMGGCKSVIFCKKNGSKWDKYIEVPVGCY